MGFYEGALRQLYTLASVEMVVVVVVLFSSSSCLVDQSDCIKTLGACATLVEVQRLLVVIWVILRV